MLLDTGKFSLDSADKSGWTPLSLAEANGHDKVVSLLREYST
jgi:ankyrin repeat protein